uniref:Uncharacterized protein n=1 Tax=Ananas comosus var. bracteatus TaxID=296719 RepID=A0A6V7NWA6_ANACO|nr:unnamed protein product [Ananas comosus var. bracteatus]
MRCDDDGLDQRRCGESSCFCGHDGDGSKGDSEGGEEVERLMEKGHGQMQRGQARTLHVAARAGCRGAGARGYRRGSSGRDSSSHPWRRGDGRRHQRGNPGRRWRGLRRPPPRRRTRSALRSRSGTPSLSGPGIYEDIVVDGCAICRSHIMDLCELDLRQITASGSSRNMATKAAISYSILYSIFPNAIFRVFGTTMGTDF